MKKKLITTILSTMLISSMIACGGKGADTPVSFPNTDTNSTVDLITEAPTNPTTVPEEVIEPTVEPTATSTPIPTATPIPDPIEFCAYGHTDPIECYDAMCCCINCGVMFAGFDGEKGYLLDHNCEDYLVAEDPLANALNYNPCPYHENPSDCFGAMCSCPVCGLSLTSFSYELDTAYWSHCCVEGEEGEEGEAPIDEPELEGIPVTENCIPGIYWRQSYIGPDFGWIGKFIVINSDGTVYLWYENLAEEGFGSAEKTVVTEIKPFTPEDSEYVYEADYTIHTAATTLFYKDYDGYIVIGEEEDFEYGSDYAKMDAFPEAYYCPDNVVFNTGTSSNTDTGAETTEDSTNNSVFTKEPTLEEFMTVFDSLFENKEWVSSGKVSYDLNMFDPQSMTSFQHTEIFEYSPEKVLYKKAWNETKEGETPVSNDIYYYSATKTGEYLEITSSGEEIPVEKNDYIIRFMETPLVLTSGELFEEDAMVIGFYEETGEALVASTIYDSYEFLKKLGLEYHFDEALLETEKFSDCPWSRSCEVYTSIFNDIVVLDISASIEHDGGLKMFNLTVSFENMGQN